MNFEDRKVWLCSLKEQDLVRWENLRFGLHASVQILNRIEDINLTLLILSNGEIVCGEEGWNAHRDGRIQPLS